jgi:hypothetical protein
MGKLPAELRGEGLAGEFKQRKGPLARVGLDRAELKFATHALDLLADVDSPGVEVDLVPAQLAAKAVLAGLLNHPPPHTYPGSPASGSTVSARE